MTVELVHWAIWPLVGVPLLLTLPPPEGVAHVASPRQKVEDEAAVPELRLATGRLPVMPPWAVPARLVAGDTAVHAET